MPGPKPRPVEDRLMEKVEQDPNSGCWLWAGAVIVSQNAKGGLPHEYGNMWGEARKVDLAHRISYRCFVGPIPDGMVICHRCDTPLCVNPRHLFAGSLRDNTQDMLSKRRGYTGTRHWNSKLSDAQVAELRSRFELGENRDKIAADFGICRRHVYQAAQNRHRSPM